MSEEDKALKGPLDEIKATISDGAKSRFADPIVSTFVVSFFVANWEIFLLVFSGEKDAEKRISLVKDLFTTDIGNILHRWVAPALVTAIYLYGWLWLMRKLILKAEKNQVERKNLRVEAEKESITIKAQLDLLVSENKKLTIEFSELDKRFGALQKVNEELKASTLSQRELSKRLEADYSGVKNLFDPEILAYSILEFAQKSGIDKSEAHKIYEQACERIFEQILQRNPQSKSIQAAKRYFDRESILGRNKLQFRDELEKFQTGKTATLDDIKEIEWIQNILKKIDDFTE